MNVFYADFVDKLGEEEGERGFSRWNSSARLFESIWVPPVDVDQLVRNRI